MQKSFFQGLVYIIPDCPNSKRQEGRDLKVELKPETPRVAMIPALQHTHGVRRSKKKETPM